MDEMRSPIATDDLMAEVAVRTSRNLFQHRADVGSTVDGWLPEDIDAAATLMQRALDHRHRLLLSELLFDEEDCTLRTSLRLQSHRPVLGAAVIALKRRIVLPVVRWLYEFSRDNFVRQQQVNVSLLASVEVLMLEVVRLRRELERMRGTGATGTAAQAPR
jgi:hypothetical protein